MITKVKQYLGNINNLEVHNTHNERANCQLDEILQEHRRWYDSLYEAKIDKNYDNCFWCVGNSAR